LKPKTSGVGWQRLLPLLLLLVPVLLAHMLLGQVLHQLQQDWREVAAMPIRMTAVYARELKAVAPTTPAVPAVLLARKSVGTKAWAADPAPPITAVESSAAASAPTEVLADLPAVPALTAVSDAVAGAVSDALADAVADAEPGPEWPLSTRLNYVLTGNYRGTVTGQAQVEWLRQGRRYQVHLDLSVGPSFAPLVSRRMSSEGELGPRGIAPQRYDEETRVLFTDRRRATVLFQGERLTLADGRQEAAPPGAQDASSQFVQLTWLFLTGRETMRVGHIVELPLVLPKRQYRWRYEVLGEELLDTPMGDLATWHLRPTQAAGRGDLSAEVWLAPSLQYLPVRLRIRQDEQTYIDLVLKAPPLQSADAAP